MGTVSLLLAHIKQRTERGRFSVGTGRLVSELLQWCQMRNASGLGELGK